MAGKEMIAGGWDCSGGESLWFIQGGVKGRIDYKDTLHNDMVKLIKTKVEWVFHVAGCEPPMDSSLELVWSRNVLEARFCELPQGYDSGSEAGSRRPMKLPCNSSAMTEYTDFEYSVSPRRRPAVKYHSTYCQAKVHRSPPQKNPLPQRCNNLITVSSRQKHRPSVRFIRLKQSNDDVAVEIARGTPDCSARLLCMKNSKLHYFSLLFLQLVYLPSNAIPDLCMPSSTRSNKEKHLLFSEDHAHLERTIRKDQHSTSLDAAAFMSTDSRTHSSTDTRPSSSTDSTPRTSIDPQSQSMVAIVILRQDENGNLYDQDGHLRNAAGQKLDAQGNHNLEKEATTSLLIDANKATSIDVKPQTSQIPARPESLAEKKDE
ncbi:hypothetical protein F2Q69_00050341 [Brassica cretica]|uniref:Uncharacterized protein n=1 Tax=Brassica cretica TaxID=69181 RepID=A0A8S9PHG2_BRACR|nr:hypothetical protein F2Q69_00050341 [Brassica cretica]